MTLTRDSSIHDVMKAPSRHIEGKVYISYTNPVLYGGVRSIDSSEAAHNSKEWQLVDDLDTAEARYFTLYDNDLSGAYVPMSRSSQVGWTSKSVSGSNGIFNEYPYVTLRFPARPIFQLDVVFDDSHECVGVDFYVQITDASGRQHSYTRSNTSHAARVPIISAGMSPVVDAVSITITIISVSKAGYPVAIIDIPTYSSVLYEGYRGSSSLISMRLLEELSYEDDIEALGGVSANEINIVLDNTSRDFNINNPNSTVARQLQRNRRIEPWLGAEMPSGEIAWYKLGTFWSYSWDVPIDNLTATVVGFDSIGLLSSTLFTDHAVLVNSSIGELIDYVLEDAKKIFTFLEWEVDSALYSVHIPYAWFAVDSHAAALRRICASYHMNIYCDRDGRVRAVPQHLRRDTSVDTWSDDTNVINKSYSSLHTSLPNIINVEIINPILLREELVKDEVVFDIADVHTRILNFNKPFVSDIEFVIDKDVTVDYLYTLYSWGIEFKFIGTGTVRSITCFGTALDTTNTSLVTVRDDESILLNGAITRDIKSDFIQTYAMANTILDGIQELSKYDIYDVDVEYRGNIALTLNDQIILQDGIAPDSRYVIKRHELTWDGGLTGSANLNT